MDNHKNNEQQDRSTNDRINEMTHILLQVGRVVQASQQMENSIKLTLTLFDTDENAINSDEKFDDIFAPFSKATLGNLIRKIRSKIEFEPKDIYSLERAISERNHVIHSFFNENGTLFLSSEGRYTAYMKLMKAQKEIESGYKILDSIVNKCLTKHGIDIDEISKKSGEIFDKS